MNEKLRGSLIVTRHKNTNRILRYRIVEDARAQRGKDIYRIINEESYYLFPLKATGYKYITEYLTNSLNLQIIKVVYGNGVEVYGG